MQTHIRFRYDKKTYFEAKFDHSGQHRSTKGTTPGPVYQYNVNNLNFFKSVTTVRIINVHLGAPTVQLKTGLKLTMKQVPMTIESTSISVIHFGRSTTLLLTHQAWSIEVATSQLVQSLQ